MNFKRVLIILAGSIGLAGSVTVAQERPVAPAPSLQQTEVSLLYNYSSADTASGTERRLFQLAKSNPGLVIKEWSGLSLTAQSGRASLMMAIAGDAGPDLFVDSFEQISNDVKQGVLYPLNEWIGQDLNHDGAVTGTEAIWPGWNEVDPLWRRIATVDGKVYALPIQSSTKTGIVFRKDIARRAGLNPNHPPKTWDEFVVWCQKLTDPQRGQSGFAFLPDGNTWVPWMQSAGGSPVVQVRRGPVSKKDFTFPMDAVTFRVSETGEDLTAVPPTWQANFDSRPGIEALAMFHRLRWQTWIREPQSGNPIEVGASDITKGFVRSGALEYRFKPEDVVTGCSRPAIPGFAQRGVLDMLDWLTRGDVAMMQIFIDNLPALGTVNVDLLGTFPIPAGPGGKPVLSVTQNFLVMTRSAASRTPTARNLIWKTMTTLTDREAYRAGIRSQVFSGSGRFVTPEQLKEAGLEDYLSQIPSDAARLNADLKSGAVIEQVPPFVGSWQSMGLAMQQNVLSPMLSPSGRDFNYASAMTDLVHRANEGGMFSRPEEQMHRFRPVAYLALCLVLALAGWLVVWLVRRNPLSRAPTKAGRLSPIAFLMLAPAVLTIITWRYYPLAKGLTMAFQDYHLATESRWVGLDNFINIFLNPDFYIFIRQTAKFVVLNFLFVFTTPILLSLMLTEVRRGRFLWRMLYFLPQLSSGLVIALLWKLMYDPTPGGILNRLLHAVGIGPQDWLGNPRTAMMSTILPALWASAGFASLDLYIAALQTIPDEFYEAAEVDGAGILMKLRHVTMPMLAPLVLINFVGTFIGTFQGMGNIFLLTFGGPGKETMVMSMAIWIEAYNNLNFSMATTMAWVMGAGLLFMTYWQVRLLGRVEFRQTEK